MLCYYNTWALCRINGLCKRPVTGGTVHHTFTTNTLRWWLHRYILLVPLQERRQEDSWQIWVCAPLTWVCAHIHGYVLSLHEYVDMYEYMMLSHGYVLVDMGMFHSNKQSKPGAYQFFLEFKTLPRKFRHCNIFCVLFHNHSFTKCQNNYRSNNWVLLTNLHIVITEIVLTSWANFTGNSILRQPVQ
jgi:hypothetical protein